MTPWKGKKSFYFEHSLLILGTDWISPDLKWSVFYVHPEVTQQWSCCSLSSCSKTLATLCFPRCCLLHWLMSVKIKAQCINILDGWILAKLFFAHLRTERQFRSINTQKKKKKENEANIKPSCPNKLGQYRIFYIASALASGIFSYGVRRVIPRGQDSVILSARVA